MILNSKPKVIVAMSGGVDSSVAAALLKNQGYNVVGVFLLMHKNSNSKDAQKVAQKLKIPFKILDAQKEFKKKVINYFIDEYKKGNMPNPCVECNPQIKFKFLVDLAIKMKADFIATGHYAKVKNGKLFIAKDTKKDQSYFLWQLNKKQLSKIIFPLGDYNKGEVRGLAKKFKLLVAEKKDSQEICFVNTNINEFLKKRIVTNKGLIITNDGKKVGEHKGLIFYTIGQRKGIEIGGTGPYYVIQKDFKNNVLIISNSQKDLLQKEMIIKNVNWLNKPKKFPFKCGVKIRSMAKLSSAKIFLIHNSRFRILLNEPQRAITPGQSVVFYRSSEVLGGGVIT